MTKPTARTRTALLASLTALALTVQAGTGLAAAAAAGGTDAPAAAQSSAAKASSPAVVNAFEALLKKPSQLPQAIVYLKANIGRVSKWEATVMTLHLENAVKSGLAAQQRQFEPSAVQEAIGRAYRLGDSLEAVAGRTSSASLKALLRGAAAAGYKLETAEGMFFPVVDYEAFKPFGPSVTADIQAYIDLMAVESQQPRAKDNALVIGYQELVRRALAQERFIGKYPGSNRAAAVRELYGNYKLALFYGLNNTPLFDYDTNRIQPNAHKGYAAMIAWHGADKSALLDLLQAYLTLIDSEGGERTAKVDAFLKTNLPIA